MTPTLCNRSHLGCCAAGRLLASKFCCAAAYVLALLCWLLVAARCYVSLLVFCILYFPCFFFVDISLFIVVSRFGPASCKGSQLHGVCASFSSARLLFLFFFFLLLVIFKMRHYTPFRSVWLKFCTIFFLASSCRSFLTK